MEYTWSWMAFRIIFHIYAFSKAIKENILDVLVLTLRIKFFNVSRGIHWNCLHNNGYNRQNCTYKNNWLSAYVHNYIWKRGDIHFEHILRYYTTGSCASRRIIEINNNDSLTNPFLKYILLCTFVIFKTNKPPTSVVKTVSWVCKSTRFLNILRCRKCIQTYGRFRSGTHFRWSDSRRLMGFVNTLCVGTSFPVAKLSFEFSKLCAIHYRL